VIPVVRFTSIKDYRSDLILDHRKVDGKVVRANGLWKLASNGMPLEYVSFVATCRVILDQPDGYIYRLELYLGEVLRGDHEQLNKIEAKIAQRMNELESICAELGLQLRRTGLIEVAK
jgi:hypothetical protein